MGCIANVSRVAFAFDLVVRKNRALLMPAALILLEVRLCRVAGPG